MNYFSIQRPSGKFDDIRNKLANVKLAQKCLVAYNYTKESRRLLFVNNRILERGLGQTRLRWPLAVAVRLTV